MNLRGFLGSANPTYSSSDDSYTVHHSVEIMATPFCGTVMVQKQVSKAQVGMFLVLK